jgi:hypothetical protein
MSDLYDTDLVIWGRMQSAYTEDQVLRDWLP